MVHLLIPRTPRSRWSVPWSPGWLRTSGRPRLSGPALLLPEWQVFQVPHSAALRLTQMLWSASTSTSPTSLSIRVEDGASRFTS